MELSSLRRLRYYCGLTNKPENNRGLLSLLSPVSMAIEQYLRRELELKSRIEDFDTEEGVNQFFTNAYPVVSVAHLYTSSQGLFTGEEIEENVGQYHVTAAGRSVILRRPLSRYPRGARLEYTAGLAASAVESTYTLTGVGSQAFEADQYVQGSRSGAMGLVVSNTPGTSLTLENLYGVFRVGDVLTAYVQEDAQGNAVVNTGGTVSAMVTSSLAVAHPALVQACEFEVNYLFKNNSTSNLWTESTSKEQTNKRGYQFGFGPMTYSLQPEARAFLRGYERELL